jgi:NAD(P)-dependent dehydrogenase (short-subunit alcohol dehydrogenase family)
MQVNFKSKVAVVTGGASGMGAALCKMIVDAGGQLVIADIDEAVGASLAKQLGTSAQFVRTDVSQWVDAQRLAARALEAFGHIDVLFNNAGRSSLADATTLDPA